MKRTPGKSHAEAHARVLQILIEEWECSYQPAADEADADEYAELAWPVYGTVYAPEKPGTPPVIDMYLPPGPEKVALMQARVANGFRPLHRDELRDRDDGSALQVGDVVSNDRNGRPMVVEFLTDAAARCYSDGIAEPGEPVSEIKADWFALQASRRAVPHG